MASVVQNWLSVKHPFRLELEKRRFRSIQARFMKKYFQAYKSAFEKFALNDELTQG